VQLEVPGEVGGAVESFLYENVLDFKMLESKFKLVSVAWGLYIVTAQLSGHMMSNYATFSSKHVCNQNKYWNYYYYGPHQCFMSVIQNPNKQDIIYE